MTRIPHYKVTIWESVAVLVGAIALIGVGLLGLTMKFIANAQRPQQADAIANNIIKYDLPNAQSVLGLNFVGARVALITNDAEQPDIQLLAARMKVDQAIEQRRIERFLDTVSLGDAGDFKVTKERIELQEFCGQTVPVTIGEGRTKRSASESIVSVTYRASVTLNRDRYIISLLASGQDAREKAAAVFDSLQCQQ
ncbi:hypothetical protein [Myxacorys almedinensis]|uniref:Uncharacterized protein n=1 Tax=Myxacorys almedinensis A TaxID=2690445 RepID=A0A8J8CMB0_9CYAN|nr:hypothetical protein [Myxacorys almedinensis]NDJ18530.1 hypothetical protein [Myxacorys almedinensis A]